MADEWLNRVSVFDREGAYQRHFSTVQPGDPAVNGSCGIAISPGQTLYVTDGRSHRVRRFRTDGTFLGSFGSQGPGEGEFDSPWGIAVDKDGFVYVADSNNHRVQKLAPDGAFVAQFGRPGNKKGDLNYPSDVTVDPDGDVYVCDWSENRWNKGRIHIFDATGKFLTSLTGDAQQLFRLGADHGGRQRGLRQAPPGSADDRAGMDLRPATGVEYDAENNRLVVVDTQRSRLQIYNKVSSYLVPQLNL